MSLPENEAAVLPHALPDQPRTTDLRDGSQHEQDNGPQYRHSLYST